MMQTVDAFIQSNALVAGAVLLVAFAILAKCADAFVESAVGFASKLNVPQLVIGIVLVSFATTLPELSVSLMSAIEGKPEMALGNAIGSVICDDGLALALAGVFSAAPIMVVPRVIKTSGAFLLSVEIVAFLFIVFDKTLDRWQGAVLVALYAAYTFHLYRLHKSGAFKESTALENFNAPDTSAGKLTLFFVLGLLGILIASRFIIVSATTIAVSLHVPETVIALTLVALGTSIPEVATCVVAARKGHGGVAVGNIIGADILNICWVAGASAVASPLTLGAKEIYFMFPSMFLIVGAMLIFLSLNYRFTRTKGALLFVMYLLYLGVMIYLFPPSLNGFGN
ncbi:MAG: calcium/sodium antiporter [Chitinispirillaceae bacterium]|nr:calcium/sodium antiporter [Chitinispirillaceae bacterium]